MWSRFPQSLFRRAAEHLLERVPRTCADGASVSAMRSRTVAFSPPTGLPFRHAYTFPSVHCKSNPINRVARTPRRPRAKIAPAVIRATENGPSGTAPQPPPHVPTNVPIRKKATFAEPSLTDMQVGPDGLPVLVEDDLEESFIRGSGPGGQKINKTASCVVIKHKPSGVTVKCQESRSQTKNRQLARKILQRKLDEIIRGEESLAARELSKARARKAKRRRKAIKKHFKSRRDKAVMDDRMSDY